jgi:arylsulfatase A-like enzyme
MDAHGKKPLWPQITPAPASAPDIAYIILDDVGFAWLGCYGAPINTPNIDKRSANGYKKKNCCASYM